MRIRTKYLFPLLFILLLTPCLLAYVQSCDSAIARQDTVQVAVTAVPTVVSHITNAQGPSNRHSASIPEIREYVGGDAGDEFPFRLYVTPEDQAIEALAARIDGVGDAYKLAVLWISVSDQKLNQVTDKWLTPHDFLTSTPDYPGNPVKGEEVGDCEEQANTLVSLFRAEGIRPEEVRVALGEVKFGDRGTGHAWVELLLDGNWIALEPSSGPYWDDKVGKLIRRRGVPFDYYASHTYPIVQVWAYYNDIYYLDLIDSSGNAPASWSKAAPGK